MSDNSEELLDLANAAGGNANVTCVLARFHSNSLFAFPPRSLVDVYE